MKKIDREDLYPVIFDSIYKELMWGGDLMGPCLGRTLPKTETPIGEAWEVVDRQGDQSVVANGTLKGVTIRELLDTYGSDIMGTSFKGGRFPLLIKIIDAGQRLSLQVHPDEASCKEIPGAEPKTEMWYVISAKDDAKIIAGLSHKGTKQKFMDTYQSNAVENCLQVSKSNPGDAYFIKAGTVHAIGEGNLILEIQQNSNTTYRISDWGRVDSNGKSRELHIDEAMKCIHFLQRKSCKIAGVVSTTNHNRKFPIVESCPFFKVDDLKIVDEWTDETDGKSFHTITPINNPVEVSNGKTKTDIPKGRTCLIPAIYGKYSIKSPEGETTTVIKSTL